MQSRLDVWATAQDTGETAGMLPVVRELCRAGISVQLLAAGRALEMFQDNPAAAPCGYWDATNPVEIEAEHPAPRMLLATTAKGGGAGRDLIPLLRGRSTTVLLQSLWSGLADWGQEHQPDFCITNDRIGERTLATMWPGLKFGSVFKTGFPMLDQYAGFDVLAESGEARRILGIEDMYPIVVFAGQADATGAMLAELVEVLNIHHKYIHFVPRPHPSMVSDFQSEVEPWHKALNKYQGKITDGSKCSMRQLVAAAYQWGAVVSMYSTTLLEAAATRTTAIAMLYPEALKAFRKGNPGLEQFPLAELGCAENVTDRPGLEGAILQALTDGNIWRARQEQHIVVDGQNAYRAAQVILRLPMRS